MESLVKLRSLHAFSLGGRSLWHCGWIGIAPHDEGGPVKLRDALDAISTDGRPTHVYSQPYETADGVTVIAVAKVRGKVRPVKANALEAVTEEVAVHARPVGVFVVRG